MPLENLLEFIAQNFIFVAVLIGGLISMFGRMAGGGQEQQEKRRNTNQRPRQPQQQEEQVDWRDIFKQEEMKPEPQPQPVQAQTIEQPQLDVPLERDLREQELRDRYDELRKKREKNPEWNRKKREETTKVSRDREGLDLQLNRLSNQEAMKAVVWSEILGRPRARQPHNTFARKR
ncbi:hypothetical protein N0O92_16370 [Alkalihalobacillus sp. MEB130]|uniref:hypothetical protein n=1 Tax=Alkalihalobacillus sp. MEB130 TaxID=2976704 RepID=UPI0028E0207A|nr:hypothetical protein [Alkalihalobacillus sp. MEB130]MDT8861789.1 hypothetical protein [Alkalihalobacillus sp. MEB130]